MRHHLRFLLSMTADRGLPSTLLLGATIALASLSIPKADAASPPADLTRTDLLRSAAHGLSVEVLAASGLPPPEITVVLEQIASCEAEIAQIQGVTDLLRAAEHDLDKVEDGIQRFGANPDLDTMRSDLLIAVEGHRGDLASARQAWAVQLGDLLENQISGPALQSLMHAIINGGRRVPTPMLTVPADVVDWGELEAINDLVTRSGPESLDIQQSEFWNTIQSRPDVVAAAQNLATGRAAALAAFQIRFQQLPH